MRLIVEIHPLIWHLLPLFRRINPDGYGLAPTGYALDFLCFKVSALRVVRE